MIVYHLMQYVLVVFFFFFKQKTAYEMRISDWSSDVCSSDLLLANIPSLLAAHAAGLPRERLLKQLPGCGQAAMDAALGRLLGRGVIIERGSQLMLPRPDEDRARTQNESERAAQIAELREIGRAHV